MKETWRGYRENDVWWTGYSQSGKRLEKKLKQKVLLMKKVLEKIFYHPISLTSVAPDN
jgi:hypothetical protein